MIGFVGDARHRRALGAARTNYLWLATDLGRFEAAVNPIGREIDSKLHAVLALPSKQIIVDAGVVSGETKEFRSVADLLHSIGRLLRRAGE